MLSHYNFIVECFRTLFIAVQVVLPLTTCLLLQAVISFAAWKLVASLTDFARRRADAIMAGQRGGGGGDSDQNMIDVLYTASTRAFYAQVAVLSASAFPALIGMFVCARRKYNSLQQVSPVYAETFSSSL
jgi:hypothetical protein